MVYNPTHRWSKEESFAAYLLSRAPCNRTYTRRRNGEVIWGWSKPNYDLIAEQLDLLFHDGVPLRAENSLAVESHLISRRVYNQELSRAIALHRVISPRS